MHSETGAHFRKLPSLLYCTATQKCGRLKQPLPVERRPDCVVSFKRLKCEKKTSVSLRDTDLCMLRAQIATIRQWLLWSFFFSSPSQNKHILFGVLVFWNISGRLNMHSSSWCQFLMFIQLQIHSGSSPVQLLVFSGHWAALLEWFWSERLAQGSFRSFFSVSLCHFLSPKFWVLTARTNKTDYIPSTQYTAVICWQRVEKCN